MQCCCQDLFVGLETETLAISSRDRDLGLQVSRPRPGQNELESRDHGLEITTLVIWIKSVMRIEFLKKADEDKRDILISDCINIVPLYGKRN